jgi:hypothetical protein
MRPRTLGIALAAVVVSVPAFADEMVVGNGTENPITRLMVPPSGSEPQTNILNPGQTIDPDRTLSLEFDPTSDGCVFDVWALFANDTVKMLEAYDACRVTDLNDENQWAVFHD